MRQIVDFGVNYNEIELKNGVKLHSFYKPNSPIYFRIYFYAGSQFDGEKPGLAHFCEHMLLAGTKQYPTKSDLNEKFQETGVRRNAFTNRKNLWFTFDLADKSDFHEMISLVKQILGETLFAQESIDIERKVILAEQGKKVSNPTQFIGDLQSSLLFQNTNIENPVMGFDESVKNINSEDLINYRDQYVSSGQISYFISGDFDEEDVIRSLNGIGNNFRPIDVNVLKLPVFYDKKKLIKNIGNTEQNYIGFSTRISPITNKKDKVVADIFNSIFGQGNTCRLHKKLRNELGLVYGVTTNIANNSEFASFIINTSCKVADTKKVIGVVNEELIRVIQDGVNEKEFKRAKKNIFRDLRFNSESASFWVSPQIMKELTSTPDPLLVDEYIKILEEVSVQDVGNFLKNYLHGRELLLACVGDFNE